MIINVIRVEGDWPSDDLTCPLLNIELLIHIVVIGNYWENPKAKDNMCVSNHRMFLASSQNILFEEPA